MSTSTLTLRLDASERRLLADCAKAAGMSVSEFVRTSALERVEDELDLKVWDEAKHEYDRDPGTFTAAEIAAKYL